MKFETLTAGEIQSIWFELKTKKAMQAFFGHLFTTVVVPLVKAGKVEKPTDYVKRMPDVAFNAHLARCGTFKNMAKEFGVSVAFIRAKHKEVWHSTRLTNKEFLLAGLERLGSVRMFCRIYNIKESEVRSIAKENEINLAPFLNWEFGDYAANRGRRAEVWWKEQRGDLVLRDLNETDSSQADYDFDDASWGRVNVKSSKQYKFKARCRRKEPYYWTFSTSAVEKCDVVVIVFYDRSFENALGWAMIPAEHVLALGKKTFTVKSVTMEELQDGRRIESFEIE